MPLRLSMPEIDASIDMPEFAAPAKGCRGIPAFFEFETEEPMAAVSKVSAESFGIALVSSGRLALGEPTFEAQAGLSRTHESGKSRVIEARIPELEWPARQDPILTDSVRRLLKALGAIVVSRALQVGFPLHRTIVSVFEDPIEQERKAILRLACSASASQALAFWDSLEPDLQGWLKTLSENDRTTFITKLGLRVHWR